jgi:Uma2 family endonuclease
VWRADPLVGGETKRMSTIITPARQPSASAPGDFRIAVRGVTWELYDRLSDSMREGRNVHLAYDGTDLEIMATGPFHEGLKDLLGVFVREVAFGVRVDLSALGQTTWKRPEILRGLEADLCFYFDEVKLGASAAAFARKSNDVRDYPNPDLAIEIDLSPTMVDRPGIYAALQVPEIWRFEDESVSIETQGPDRTYARAQMRRFVRVRPDEIVHWILLEDSSKETGWCPRLREWVQAELMPRSTTDRENRQ